MGASEDLDLGYRFGWGGRRLVLWRRGAVQEPDLACLR
ncbi:hypothetical protein STRTUCAR8_06309 [Streptomyces turgidiscabies Car8]|uniref:Uncharacterized protein n=1 Tax=Streptomyces turgidiscabies (strain Car8) TaxID=698760 RepID=L7F8H5_STRT8|nr:hypothetical protein STRTUCAR8_06309 [Streptomyces turgidiscabies Car8]